MTPKPVTIKGRKYKSKSAACRALHNMGMSQQAIAEKVGASIGHVWMALHKDDIRKRKGRAIMKAKPAKKKARRRLHNRVDVNSLHILTGIPIPSRNSLVSTDRWQVLARRMKPGQSVKLPKNEGKLFQMAASKAGGKVTLRRVNAKTYMAWLVKKF